MPAIASTTAPTTSPSSATWPSISSAKSRLKAPCASRSSGPDGRTHTSPKSSLKFEMRLPCEAVLTWSGVAGVNKAYYDIARTLGASERFLVLKVAVPGAMPHVFVGLFMGLGASFSVLVVAEMLGVKAGLGWYLQWAQGWAAYANMYAALLVMALMCTGLITLLFRIRDRLLAWQKGLVQW